MTLDTLQKLAYELTSTLKHALQLLEEYDLSPSDPDATQRFFEARAQVRDALTTAATIHTAALHPIQNQKETQKT